MTKTDLSTKALLARKVLAEKATPGPWANLGRTLVVSRASADEPIISDVRIKADTHHIAANSPDVVIATIDEVLRLRAECARLERELVGAIDVMECLLAGKPGGVYFQKYQGGLQIALRSAQLALSGAAHRAVEKGNE